MAARPNEPMAGLNSFLGDGDMAWAGLGSPAWVKNNTKLYVVAYPSNKNSTQFLADPSTPKVLRPESVGYGIFYEPKKISKTKFWKEKGGEPTLFTVEENHLGHDVALKTRKGAEYGINGLLVRFLIDSKDDVGKIADVHQALNSVFGGHIRDGGEEWLRDALAGLIKAGLIKSFGVEEFVSVARGVVAESMVEEKEKQVGVNSVVSMDWEEYITKKEKETGDVIR